MVYASYESHINLFFRTEFGRHLLTFQRILFILTASVNLNTVSQDSECHYSTKFIWLSKNRTLFMRYSRDPNCCQYPGLSIVIIRKLSTFRIRQVIRKERGL